MFNVLLKGTMVSAHRYLDTSEVVISVYDDDQGNEIERILLKAGSDQSGIWIPAGQYPFLGSETEMAVVVGVDGKFQRQKN